MYNDIHETRNEELIPHNEGEKKLFQEHNVEDPDLLRPYYVIEHNLDIIEGLQKLLTKIAEKSSEGINKNNKKDKNQVFNEIRQMISDEIENN